MIRRTFFALFLLAVCGVAARADDSGYLGIVLGQLPNNDPKGALIQELFQDSPADRDGLRCGDLIVTANDQDISDAQGLLDVLKTLKADDKARLKVRRAGEKEIKEIAVTLAKRPDTPLAEIPLKQRPSLGIAFSAQQDGSLAVAQFLPDSIAEAAGMRVDDVLTSIGGHETKDYAAVLSALAAQKDGEEVKIVVTRDGQTQELAAKVKYVTPQFNRK